MKNICVTLCLISLLIESALAEDYLLPDDIHWLSATVKADLKGQGCSIPKKIGSNTAAVYGIITGKFAAADQIDLAILCVRDNESHIRIYWGGNEKPCLAKLPSAGQSISSAGSDYIWDHYEAYGGVKPPKQINHEGINDWVLEKASSVYYCYQGKWLELSGAD